DLPALARAAHATGAAFVVDGTFTSPVLQQTLAQGADYALHSTTKWINGHSDATGGVVSGSHARIDPLRGARVLEGALLGPFEAWLTLRGIRTLPVRMAAHSTHALHVARRLREDGRIARVLYPGLPDHPDHAIARALLSGGFGGMVAFEIAGAGRAESFRFLESVRLCRPAPSLGDVTTLVMHAASASARRLTPEERAMAGIGENLIRVSVGLEDPDDIAEDLLQALQAVGRPWRGGAAERRSGPSGWPSRPHASGCSRRRWPASARGGWRRVTCWPPPGSRGSWPPSGLRT